MDRKEIKEAEFNVGSIVQSGLDRYKSALKLVIQNGLENLYGGAEKFKTQMNNDERTYDFAVDIWNEAIDRCIKEIKEL